MFRDRNARTLSTCSRPRSYMIYCDLTTSRTNVLVTARCVKFNPLLAPLLFLISNVFVLDSWLSHVRASPPCLDTPYVNRRLGNVNRPFNSYRFTRTSLKLIRVPATRAIRTTSQNKCLFGGHIEITRMSPLFFRLVGERQDS